MVVVAVSSSSWTSYALILPLLLIFLALERGGRESVDFGFVLLDRGRDTLGIAALLEATGFRRDWVGRALYTSDSSLEKPSSEVESSRYDLWTRRNERRPSTWRERVLGVMLGWSLM